MYAPQRSYHDKNICDKDGALCTYWPQWSSTKNKLKENKLKHIELRWTCFAAALSQSYTYWLCKYIASTNDHEVCSNMTGNKCHKQA